MRYHFTISYSDGFEQASAWLRQRAAEDPFLALAEQVHDHYGVVIAGSESVANWQQEQLDAGRGISSNLGLIEVYDEVQIMRVNLECGDAAIEVAARLLADLFKDFPNYSVYDEDCHESITDLVRADIHELFKSSNSAL